MTVDSVLGLQAPGYLVVDPDVPSKREWVRFASINGNSLEGLTRNLEGSVGNVDHDTGARVRTIFTAQHLNDLFNDIEENAAALTDHKDDPNDPHAAAGYLKLAVADARYLRLTGGTLTGMLTLPSTTPTLANHATHKTYVDDQDAATLVTVGTLYLPLVGGALTGDLLLSTSGSPPSDFSATSRKYVNDQIAAATGGGAALYLLLDGSNNNPSGPTQWLNRTLADSRYLLDSGTAVAAEKWSTARTHTVALAGDVTGSAAQTVDGTANKTWTVTATVVNDSHTHDTRYYTKAQVDALLAALIVPASRVSAGTFPAGTFTFSQVTVTGAVGIGGSLELPNIAIAAGTHDLRWGTGGVVTRQ
jgi:hypothetical protein